MGTHMKTLLTAMAGVLATASGAQAQVYSQNFTSNTNGFAGGVYATTPTGERYIGLANGSSTTLDVATSGFTALSLSFNLYALESLDGNGPDGGGPDNFLIYLNGAVSPAYTINVANYTSGSNSQSYNGNLSQSGPGNSYAPLTGAVARGTLGYGTGPFGDSTYNVSFALPDAALTSIRFVGATNEAAIDFTGQTTNGNEAYGIDNVVLSGQRLAGSVPEPASWAMMLLGFGSLGAAMRRKGAMRPALRPA